jgi:ABC-type sugar transport system substrate-binding protein
MRRIERMKNSKRFLMIAALAVFAMALATQGVFAQAGKDVTQGMDKKLKMLMIVHDIASPFTAFFKSGGEDAAKAHNIDFTFMGTQAIDMPKQSAMFENAIEGGFNAITLTMMDNKAFGKGLERAKAKGVAVFSFNMDGDWGKRAALGYSGADEYSQGIALGKYFFKEVMKGKGSYILCPAIADLDVLVLRMNGIKKAAEEYPDIKYITTVEIGTDLTKAYANVENAYTAHPEATALIGTDHFSESVGQVISKRGLKGKVYGAGFDITPGMMKYVKEGSIQATMGQNPYLQGYFAVEQAWLYLAKGQPPLEINTGSELVTPKNMAPYLKMYNMQ